MYAFRVSILVLRMSKNKRNVCMCIGIDINQLEVDVMNIVVPLHLISEFFEYELMECAAFISFINPHCCLPSGDMHLWWPKRCIL